MSKSQKKLVGTVLSISASGEGFVKVKVIVSPAPDLKIKSLKFMVPDDFDPQIGDVASIEDYDTQGGFTEGTVGMVSRYTSTDDTTDSEAAPF